MRTISLYNIRVMPATAQELVTQAVESCQKEKYDDALNLAREALEVDPRYGDAYSVLGICFAKKGQPEQATEAFKKAIQTTPYNASAYYNLAYFYYENGNFTDAMTMAQEAIRTDAKHKRAIQLIKILEDKLHVEVAPYTTSLGDQRGSAYQYKPEGTEDKEKELSWNDIPPLDAKEKTEGK